MFKPQYIKKTLQFLGLALGLSGLLLIGVGIIGGVFILGAGFVSLFVPTVDNAWKYLWLVGLYFLFGFIAVYSSKWLLGCAVKISS